MISVKTSRIFKYLLTIFFCCNSVVSANEIVPVVTPASGVEKTKNKEFCKQFNFGSHLLSKPDDLSLKGDSIMIVTHAASPFDGRIVTKPGIDRAVAFARSKGMQVISLERDIDEGLHFMADNDPDYFVYSDGGELTFDLLQSHVYLVGGHWDLGLCLSRTSANLLKIWDRKPKKDITISMLMDAIYTQGAAFQPTDSYFADFMDFRKLISFGVPTLTAPHENSPTERITLLEAMAIIKTDKKRFEFLERNLPPFKADLTPDYRVELWLNGNVKVLQQGSGKGPLLKLEFINSVKGL